MVSGLGWYVLFALVGTAVVWKASDVLERASKRFSAYYGLPPVVQGAIVVFGFLRTELSLSKTESWGLLAFYCLFIAWLLLETVGVTHVVPGA